MTCWKEGSASLIPSLLQSGRYVKHILWSCARKTQYIVAWASNKGNVGVRGQNVRVGATLKSSRLWLSDQHGSKGQLPWSCLCWEFHENPDIRGGPTLEISNCRRCWKKNPLFYWRHVQSKIITLPCGQSASMGVWTYRNLKPKRLSRPSNYIALTYTGHGVSPQQQAVAQIAVHIILMLSIE